MRRYLYLSTAVAGVVMTAGAGASFAQCVTTQNCAELGYACTGGSSEITPEQCTQLGFTHTCTGTNETGGSGKSCDGKYAACTCASPYTWSGSACICPSTYQYTCSGTGYSGGSCTACGGKYAACTCANGYEWKDGSCQKQVLNGAQGELYYCNGTVVGVRATGMGFYVAMKDLGTMTWTNANSSCQNYSFCGNVKGTLPRLDQLQTLYKNKSRVNTLLSTNGGTQLTNDWYWSSTGGGSTYDIVDMYTGSLSGRGYYNSHYVRPVLASW